MITTRTEVPIGSESRPSWSGRCSLPSVTSGPLSHPRLIRREALRHARTAPPRPRRAPTELDRDATDLLDDLVTGVFVRAEPDTETDHPALAPPIDLPVRLVTAVEPPARPRRRPSPGRLIALSAAAFVIGGAAVAAVPIARALRPQPLAIAAVDPARPTIDDQVPARLFVRAIEDSRVYHRRSAPYRDLWRVDAWYHPLTRELLLPENHSRKFGAPRGGRRPAECGRGHCGIDVGEFGMPVNAVRDGVVERVQRRSRDNAGRYIRIAHDNGFVSYYMHLHQVAPGLSKGKRVRGGDPIGTVGRTGIKRSPPHLHFALAYRDARKNIYIDPEPLLRRSMLASEEDPVSEVSAEPDSPLVLHGESWNDPD